MYGVTEEADEAVVKRLEEMATQKGLPMATLAMAWLLSKPGITAPIVGASKAKHLDDAVAALEVELTPDEVKTLEEAYIPHPVLGFS